MSVIDHLTMILIIFNTAAQILAYLYLYNKYNFVYQIIGLSIYSVWIISYLLTIFKNPGIPTLSNFMDKRKKNYIDDSESEIGYLTCNICNVFVKKNTQIGHCLSCKICIIGKNEIINL